MTKSKNKTPNAFSKISKWASDFIKMDKTRSAGRKIASSLWALFFGMLLAYIYIAISKGVGKSIFVNPFAIFKAVGQSFNSFNQETILKYFLVFGFSAIACALSFKAGLFNIGIPGQMMVTGIVSFSIFIKFRYNNEAPIPVHVLLISLIFSIAVAFIVGLISGTLKAYLNVHEVISTIMLNWIIVGFATLLFKQTSAPVIWNGLSPEQIKYYFADNLDGVVPGFVTISKSARQGFVIAGIIGLFVLAFSIAFVFNYTSLGYKIRMQGISKSNGKYIGVNDKRITMFVLATSAAIAGLAGFYYYVAVSTPVFSEISQPLTLGFEAIAISLLALNSPIGSLFSSLFYTAIYTSNSNLQLDPLYFEPYDIQVITSIILYMAATSIMFVNFQPINYFKRKSKLWSDKRYFANKELEKLKRKKINLITKYKNKVHHLQINANAKNYEKSIQKLKHLQELFAKKLNKVNLLITKAKLKSEQANKLFELEFQLHIAKKNKNQEEITKIKNDIKNHHLFTKKILNKEITTDFIDEEIKEKIALNKEENSQKVQIKLLRKELASLTDKHLSFAMNYKNTDDETIEYFEKINQEKNRINTQLNLLGVATKFNNKQQRKAAIKNNSFEFKKIYQHIILERTEMKKYAKGGQK
ncbi:Sugar ABC transporter permease [Metamycoplasma alkalescens 14918]|uniref:Sugar ABC transporter permease n=1 Tax=Metamycoplasma alkalescens 14918 TaxID=1188234 RepID=N9UAK9_9BACT|nr:ABC transporter permease [Metamycoplasma alkalescens]ENY53963.1 Sugar ABC transporter permease [Metamycoplasma alkalescens 14918]